MSEFKWHLMGKGSVHGKSQIYLHVKCTHAGFITIKRSFLEQLAMVKIKHIGGGLHCHDKSKSVMKTNKTVLMYMVMLL